MIALTLARMLRIDLSPYSSAEDAWFSAAYAWAEQIGLFDGISDINPNKAIERGQIAIILVKFLDFAGVNHNVTDNPIIFPDSVWMSDDEYEAFQLLCSLRIFQGKGQYRMDPRSILSRAELAVILYNLGMNSSIVLDDDE